MKKRRSPHRRPGGSTRTEGDVCSQHVAILDEGGTILAVNGAWREFAEQHAPDNSRAGEGTSYLAACESAVGCWSDEAPEVAQGIRQIIAGERDEYRCEYSCDGFDRPRWFSLHVSRFEDDGRRLIVVHDDITGRKAVEDALKERIKELHCLYRVTELLNDPGLSRDEVLQACVDTIPGSWQHPESAAARIVILGRELRTANFTETPWNQRSEVMVAGAPVGSVEVCYLGEMSEGDEGPFLREERALIDAIAEHLGRYVERVESQESLQLNEVRLNSLLRLFQRSAELDEKEIIQFALEEAVELTLSAIGYCHLVHDDQATIELVTWSRATLEVCDAVHDTHYPITQAGVWADCARIKAPVVHNDYPNLPDRKGLPAGHAELRRHVSVPVVEDGQVRLIMGVGNKAEDYDASDVRQLQLLANDAWQVVRRKRVESQLEAMAMTDALTGISNRRRLFDRGEEEVRRVQRYGGALSVLFLDIDSFKSINDRHGHDVGDEVLKEFASTVRRTLRDVDMVGRTGGEEFAVVLPNTPYREARLLAERLVQEVRRMSFSASGTTFGITVSIGVATHGENTPSFPALIKAADVALYGAKTSGRDGVFG